MNNNKKTYVVIAVFNRIEHTLKCLDLLHNQSTSDFGIIIVDDGSTDNTKEKINKLYPDVIIVKGTGDWWWTRSMREGVNKAIELGAEKIISLNNDTYFDNTFIENLISLSNKYPNAAIGSLNIVQKEDEYIFFSGIKKVIWWKGKEVKYHKAFTKVEEELTGMHPTYCLNGRGTIIPVDIYKQASGFDLKFVQYGSDYDLALSIREKGYDCLISYDNRVYSYIEETGEGKSFIKQSWGKFLKSFFNPMAQTSIRMSFRYYIKHGGILAGLSGFCFQQLRTIYSFYRKQNLLNKL